eukprot:COSAG02_NODE_3489_length_6660_cov_19.136707_1_plen_126_part_00
MYDGSDPYVSALPMSEALGPHLYVAGASTPRAHVLLARPDRLAFIRQAIVFWNDQEIGRTKVFEDSTDPEFKEKFAVRVPLSDVHENTLRVELFDFGASATLAALSSRASSIVGLLVAEPAGARR